MMPLWIRAPGAPGVHHGVGVALARRTVRGPAGVAEAVAAGQRLLLQLLLEAVELALGLGGLELAVLRPPPRRPSRSPGTPGGAGRPSAGARPRAAHVSHDSAHGFSVSSCPGRSRRRRRPPAQPSRFFCRTRPTASAPSGTSLVMTEPAAVVAPVADLDRRHQHGVAADEGAAADLGRVLADAVVVAGHDAGAEVGALADRGVSQVGEMVGLGSPAPSSELLTSTKLPTRAPRKQAGCRAQPGERTHPAAVPDLGAVQHAVGLDGDALAQRACRAARRPGGAYIPARPRSCPEGTRPGWITVSMLRRVRPARSRSGPGSRMVTPSSISEPGGGGRAAGGGRGPARRGRSPPGPRPDRPGHEPDRRVPSAAAAVTASVR